MNKKSLRLTVLLLVLVVSAGCIGVGDRSKEGEVRVSTQPLTEAEVGYHVNGLINYVAPESSDSTFDQVTICLYGEDQLVDSKTMGSLSKTQSQLHFNITTDTWPNYIFAYHPEFTHNHNRMALAWNSEQEYYVSTWVAEVDVPYPADGTAGTCPNYNS